MNRTSFGGGVGGTGEGEGEGAASVAAVAASWFGASPGVGVGAIACVSEGSLEPDGDGGRDIAPVVLLVVLLVLEYRVLEKQLTHD